MLPLRKLLLQLQRVELGENFHSWWEKKSVNLAFEFFHHVHNVEDNAQERFQEVCAVILLAHIPLDGEHRGFSNG